MKLGVNVDHVSTLREARGTQYPDPVVGAMLAEHAGCDSIVVHLREDRRHIKERDVSLIKNVIKIPLNLEMSINKTIVSFALAIKPNQATLVPERRKELTTEGGIDLRKKYSSIMDTIKKLKREGITVSVFIDPVKQQIKIAKEIGADIVELNTGMYSEAKTKSKVNKEIDKIKNAAAYARNMGFFVASGHGLDYENIKAIVRIKGIEELNIGHSIISRSVFVGIIPAVTEILKYMKQ